MLGPDGWLGCIQSAEAPRSAARIAHGHAHDVEGEPEQS